MEKLFIVTKTKIVKSYGNTRNVKCFPFLNKEDAQKKLKELRDKELAECEEWSTSDFEFDYNVYEDSDDKFELSMNNGYDEVLIFLHEVENVKEQER